MTIVEKTTHGVPDRVLHRIDRGDGERLEIAIKTYEQNPPALELRLWSHKHEDPDPRSWQPTRKGVVIYSGELAEVLRFLGDGKAALDAAAPLDPLVKRPAKKIAPTMLL